MTKTNILDRVNVKSENAKETKSNKAVNEGGKIVDLNAPASKRQTYALYSANRKAASINGCQVFNDWHKQGLTVGEFQQLIAEYNKITGNVYNPEKAKKEQPAKPAKGVTKRGKSASKEVANKPVQSDVNAGKIEALKQMKAEGLLTVVELVEALKSF